MGNRRTGEEEGRQGIDWLVLPLLPCSCTRVAGVEIVHALLGQPKARYELLPSTRPSEAVKEGAEELPGFRTKVEEQRSHTEEFKITPACTLSPRTQVSGTQKPNFAYQDQV